MDRLNEMIRELPSKRPGKVEVIDLAGWLTNAGEDERLWPDGVHFVDTTAQEVTERFLADAIFTAYKRLWSARATDQANSGPSDIAAPDAVGKYLDKRYKVLVVGDHSADLAAAGMTTWADKSGGLTVKTAVRPDCGLLRTSAREVAPGQLDPTPPECQSFRQWVIDQSRAEQPDFVLVVPSAADLGGVRLSSTNAVSHWGDPGFDKAATLQYQDLVRQINATGAVVLWANTPTGDRSKGGAGAAAKVLPATDEATAAHYDSVVTAMFDADNRGARRIDLANWTGHNLPDLRDGSDLSVDAKRTLGEWLATQAYLEYDDGPKLKTSPR